jgi:hypothetical protein
MTFASACFLAYLWSTYQIPETAGVSLEEMDRVFESDVGREDEALKGQVSVIFLPVWRWLIRDAD